MPTREAPVGQAVLRTVAKWRSDEHANPDHLFLHVAKTTGKIAAILEAADHRPDKKMLPSEVEELLSKHVPDLVLEAVVIAHYFDADINRLVAERGEANVGKHATEPPSPTATLLCDQLPRHPERSAEGRPQAIMLNGRLYDIQHVCETTLGGASA